jgi:hypothetical protein
LSDLATEAAVDMYVAAHRNAPVKTLQAVVLSHAVLPYHRARFMQSIGRTAEERAYAQLMQARQQLRRPGRAMHHRTPPPTPPPHRETQMESAVIEGF